MGGASRVGVTEGVVVRGGSALGTAGVSGLTLGAGVGAAVGLVGAGRVPRFGIRSLSEGATETGFGEAGAGAWATVGVSSVEGASGSATATLVSSAAGI